MITDRIITDVRRPFDPLTARSDFKITNIEYSVGDNANTKLLNDTNIPLTMSNGVWSVPSVNRLEATSISTNNDSFKIFISTSQPIQKESIEDKNNGPAMSSHR